jgi:hypothetical protein
MDVKRTPQGQVVQENSKTLSSDQNNPLTEAGPALKLGFVDGKQGEVRKVGMAQTDWTNDKGGPAPKI